MILEKGLSWWLANSKRQYLTTLEWESTINHLSPDLRTAPLSSVLSTARMRLQQSTTIFWPYSNNFGSLFQTYIVAVLSHLHIIVGWTTGLAGGTLWMLLLFLMFYAWFRTYLVLWQTWVDRGVKFQTMLECTKFCTFVIMNPLLGWKVNRQKITECCRRTQVQEPPSQCVFSEELPFGWLSGGNCRVNPRLRLTAGSISGTELSPYLWD